MSGTGRIGRGARGILRTLADIFDVEGVEDRMPNKLATEQGIIPVYDVGQLTNPYTRSGRVGTSTIAAGTSAVSQIIVVSDLDTGTEVLTGGRETLIQWLSGDVVIAAADAAAFAGAGQFLEFTFLLRNPDGNQAAIAGYQQPFIAARTRYPYRLDGYLDHLGRGLTSTMKRWVPGSPAGYRFVVQAQINDPSGALSATTWPAAGFSHSYSIEVIQFAAGRLPAIL